ncbi:hypothetical protein KXD93_23605 [Mucilaginibacter sp. BJC16-A38]|uniref:hypothetical protein n=1 Tax=Mucilaginibacter phenanthrenivorans TaxID=1234842 RepID=UPI002157F39C|nr:hypothetical protein [Mucilaginibacter phenanthrenivorans]MCR8560662.1 hypothetical protein [Mucilaginibacter phenanthrenivorans]
MDTSYYLQIFQSAAEQLDKQLFARRELKIAVVVYHESVVLKVYKQSWASPVQDPLTAETRIFFSVWINYSETQKQKLFYNIHAFKLRKLSGYEIESRKFAAIFRSGFKKYEHEWQNVSLNFGPLTLMQGWVQSETEQVQDEIIKLSYNFLEIVHLIDSTIATFKI